MQFGCDFRNAFAIGFGGVQVVLRDFVCRVRWATLRHNAGAGAQAVVGAVVHFGLADPNHALLHRQCDEILKGGELVATQV